MRISDWSSDVCSSDLLGLGEAMFDRAALLQLDERQRLFPRAFPGDRAYGDLIEYLPARRVAEIAGENRRILGERDLRQQTPDDRFADILGGFARAILPGVGTADPRPEACDRPPN